MGLSWIDDNKGLLPWTFVEASKSASYNEGHKIATSSSPIWDSTQSITLREPITPRHIPCRYWGKGLYNIRQRVWYIYGVRWRGVVLYVGPNGDYTTITAALNATYGVDVLLVLEGGIHDHIDIGSGDPGRTVFIKGDMHEPTDVVVSHVSAVFDLWRNTNLYIEGVTLSCATQYQGSVIRSTALSSKVIISKCIISFPNITKYGGFLVQEYGKDCYVSFRLAHCTINTGRYIIGGNDNINTVNLAYSYIEQCITNTIRTRYCTGSFYALDYVTEATPGYGSDYGTPIITSRYLDE